MWCRTYGYLTHQGCYEEFIEHTTDGQCVTPSRAGGASRVASTIATSSICGARPGVGRSVRLYTIMNNH